MEIILQELLNSDFFRESEVLAGEQGLCHKVTSVNVLDAPDGYKYMKEGALVVTTAYSLLNNPEDQLLVIEKLAEKKVAALGIKLRFFNYILPEIMKKKADEVGLPIISLSNQYAYADLLEFLMSNLLLHKNMAFIRKEKVYEQFLKSADDDGLQGIAKLLSTWTGFSVALFYDENKLEYPMNFLPANFLDNKSNFEILLLNENYSGLQEQIYRYSWEYDEELFEWIGVELRCRNRIKGNLFLFKRDRAFDNNDYLLMDFAAMACKVEVKRLNLIEQEQQKYISQYIEHLLNGQIKTKEEAVVGAKSLSLILPREAKIFYFKIKGNLDNFHIDIIEIINSYLNSKFKTNIIVATLCSGIVALVPTEINSHHQLPEELLSLLKNKLSNLDFYIGIGRTSTFKQFQKSFHEAKHAVEIGIALGSTEKIFQFEKLGFYRILFAAQSPDELRIFYGGLLCQDNFLTLFKVYSHHLSLLDNCI
ncbi:PucR family transcriptional regulator ligand-binding domain-containing protein [Candidatus Formimonas warabiya]|uniref:Purine catabolism PurC-like domain-containing protein n=1 Tax=Formimonas warabiya TaxID=1761012 RepID=A0A3G1KQC6_FORW1|nr:PucR family transcriptional regulator ligand-binding domain-containing protein [Candidatus Formimonas warabiya]ATW24637.1 hypothetical protein DCMF_07455 [Candidatus Formimonas warabiya]